MKKTLGIITSVFAISIALSSCSSDPHNVQRDPEPVANKAFDKPLELKTSTTVDSTAKLDGKSFTVKSIGPVKDDAQGLPEAQGNSERIGVVYQNDISPASSASASVDGMPQEMLGVKSGEGTVVLVVPKDAKNAYALISFGTKGSIKIDMLTGKATANQPPAIASSADPSLVPYKPSPAATQPFTEPGGETIDPDKIPGAVQTAAPGNFGPSLPATTGK